MTPPRPTVTPTDSGFDPRQYPQYPHGSSFDRDSAVRFAWEYEEAYRWNIYLSRVNADRVGTLTVESDVVSVLPAEGGGFVVGVNTELTATPGTVEESTATSIPYSTSQYGTWLYLTADFAVRAPLSRREGDISSDGTPKFEDTTVVACSK